jgi:hypothetical protein
MRPVLAAILACSLTLPSASCRKEPRLEYKGWNTELSLAQIRQLDKREMGSETTCGQDSDGEVLCTAFSSGTPPANRVRATFTTDTSRLRSLARFYLLPSTAPNDSIRRAFWSTWGAADTLMDVHPGRPREPTDPVFFDRWARHGDSAFVMLFDSGTEKTLVVQFQRLPTSADRNSRSR